MEQIRCYGCMQLKTQRPLCEHCGYNEHIDNLSHQLPLGTLLKGRYLVGKALGQGGFGITYLGWDQEWECRVAIKEFFPNGSVNRESTSSLMVSNNTGTPQVLFQKNLERFMKEARTLTKLADVPQIVHVHDLFEENATAYIVMEYIQGVDLRRYVQMAGGRLGAEWTLKLMKPVLDGLERVHAEGLVHRDISPDNIMILPDGSAKLLDFGAVREVLDADVDRNLSRSTEAILKHGFAPMEQYQRQGTLGPWTDVYALCASMFYCMTGRVPSDAPNRIVEDLEIPWEQVPGLSRNQIGILKKGMAMKARDRVRSVAELSQGLYTQAPPAPAPEPVPRPEPQPTPDPDPRPVSQPPYKGKGLLIAAAALAVVIGGIAIFGGGGKQEVPVSSGESVSKPAQSQTLPETGKPEIDPNQKPVKVQPLQAGDYGRAAAVNKLSDGASWEVYLDEQKNEVLRILRDQAGKVLYRSQAERDEQGDIRIHSCFDAEGNLIRQDEYTRDTEGRVLQRLTWGEQETLYEYLVNEFDALGNLTVSQTWNRQGERKEIRIRSYDVDGNQTKVVWENAAGESSEEIYSADGKSSTYVYREADGKERSRTEYLYGEDGKVLEYTSSWEGGPAERTIYQWNADGDIQKSTTYDTAGAITGWTEYSYDALGNQTKHVSWYQDGSEYSYENMSSIIGTSLYSYNNNHSSYGDSSGLSRYNGLGQSVEHLSYDESGKLSGRNTTAYDINGNQTESCYESYHDNGSVSYVGTTTYSADGKTTGHQSVSYNEKGAVSYSTEDTYDSQGSKVASHSAGYDDNGTVNYSNDTEYTYNGAGNLTGSQQTSHYSSGRSSINTYDTDGNVLVSRDFDENGTETDYTAYDYEFDANGNVAKKTARDAAGKVQRWTQYEYNEFGKVSKETNYDSTGNVSYWTEYTYDAYGNYKDSETHWN